MHEEIIRALDSGATVITASRRLARVLAREFHSIQGERWRTVWNRPDVLPLDAFLDRLWREWLSHYASESAPVLLNESQEQALWEQIIRESPAGASLLRIPETARQAILSWRLMLEYRLPLDGSFEAVDDWAGFAAWAREFRQRCGANGWLERARLGDFLLSRVDAGEVERPLAVYVAGFDEKTPQQTEFFDALGEWRSIQPQDRAPDLDRRKLRDASEEIRSAAHWARKLLAADPETQIGIIVAPDLTRSRAKVARILGEILEPGAERASREQSVHLSVGPALAEYPVIHAALLMLEFSLRHLLLPRAGMLLRSPFLGGAEKEWTHRAQLDAKLRRKGLWDVSVSLLMEEAGSCPQLQRVLRRVEKQFRKIPQEQPASDWSRSVDHLLEAYGWPGDRTPNSEEFQIIAEWRSLLSSLASLDLTAPPLNLAQVIDWLRQQTAATRFQVEDEGAPVQVMGMLEASGLRFDRLWIIGLHDEALPAPANPNPFLPNSLQFQHRLPHSSAERELEFAGKLLDRLIASAPHVVLSYPQTEGDRALVPSPLISGPWSEDQAPASDWIMRMRAAAVFDEIQDETGPALVASGSPGGASLFKDMAACPFRSFAKHRLAARPLEEADLGLSYRDRGTTVHKALEVIWRELGSHARLMELSAGELQALIARAAEAAVAKLGPGIGRDLEKQRLQRLLPEWLALEKSRPEFSVAFLEAESVVEIGGFQIKTRADRVDALPDGRAIVLDYKTGKQLSSRGWEGERPDEPQLPLYCATSHRPVAGAAFAMIHAADLRFRGLTAGDVSLPSWTKMSIDPCVPFELQLVEWRSVLQHLAQDYRAGKAQVDPKNHNTCNNCGLRAFCRIRELGNDSR
jgi:probable DNA repair protein